MSEPVQTTNKTKRYNMRMYDADYALLEYWSGVYGVDKSEFLMDAMKHYIKWRNQDYDLPTAEQARLNQMVDAVENLTARQARLESSVIKSMDAMLGIMRGANYLVEDEDGQL